MNKIPVTALSLLLALTSITACDGGGSVVQPMPPQAPNVNVDAGLKQLIFSWAAVPGATHYRLLENPDGHSGFTQTGADIPSGTLSVTLNISVHLHDFVNALYFVQACNSIGCTGSTEISAMNVMLGTIGYFKASNTDAWDRFGSAIALSADGKTLAVGAIGEQSTATGINGDQSENSDLNFIGAVYVFRFDGTQWYQQAYVKASNAEIGANFGDSISLSADGNTLAVGSSGEASAATGINGDQSRNTNFAGAGAVYVFRFDGADWYQQAYIKASNTRFSGNFGRAVELSADGNTLAVGSPGESESAAGINPDSSEFLASSGAAYVFRFDGDDWFQQAYIKASNPDRLDHFGESIALSTDGSTLAVGALSEDSAVTGIDGDQSDNSVLNAGAVYLFRFDGDGWFQEAYIKASNTGNNPVTHGDEFGDHVALSGDGDTLAVGAHNESSSATGINGDQSDNSARQSGAVYLFRFDGSEWFQRAYIKASDTARGFGKNVGLTKDANMLMVSGAREIVYVFRFDGTNWSELTNLAFGGEVALSGDGDTLAVGAHNESSSATGINGDQSDNSAPNAGAVYLF